MHNVISVDYISLQRSFGTVMGAQRTRISIINLNNNYGTISVLHFRLVPVLSVPSRVPSVILLLPTFCAFYGLVANNSTMYRPVFTRVSVL